MRLVHCSSIALLCGLLIALGCDPEEEATNVEPSDDSDESSDGEPTVSDADGPLADLAGRYRTPGVGPTQTLVVSADGSYELTSSGSPMAAGTERGTVTREDDVLTFAPEGEGQGPRGALRHHVRELD